MSRRCGQCGWVPPDGEARFCNQCGSAIVDLPEPGFPVCGACGCQVADPRAQFCDKCGAAIQKEPVRPACPSCGNKAIDENSKFCTRCGASFQKPGLCAACGFQNPDEKALYCNRCGSPLPGKGPVAVAPADPAPSVVIAKKRSLPPQPAEQPAEWDPWSDGSPEYDIAGPGREDPSFPQPEPPAPVAPPAAGIPEAGTPGKRYAHLPLIADELKGPKTQYAGPEEPPLPPPRGSARKKKGVLGFLKK